MIKERLVCFDSDYHRPVGSHFSKTWANTGISNAKNSKLPYNDIALGKDYALIDVIAKNEFSSGQRCDFFFMTYPDWSFYDLFLRSKNRNIYIILELWSFVSMKISASSNCYVLNDKDLKHVEMENFDFTDVSSDTKLQKIKFKVNTSLIKNVLCRGIYFRVDPSCDINMTIKSVYFEFDKKI